MGREAIFVLLAEVREPAWERFRVIAQMHVAEATAKRLFSVLRDAFRRNRVRGYLRLLDSTFAIRMWQGYHALHAVGEHALSVVRATREACRVGVEGHPTCDSHLKRFRTMGNFRPMSG
jgi:hypothetical protein